MLFLYPSFNFRLFVSLYVKVVSLYVKVMSYRKQVVGSCFLNPIGSSLLFELFSSFAFNVVIDIIRFEVYHLAVCFLFALFVLCFLFFLLLDQSNTFYTSISFVASPSTAAKGKGQSPATPHHRFPSTL